MIWIVVAVAGLALLGPVLVAAIALRITDRETDGAGYFGRFWHVILPLSRNALVALGIFVFLGHYNDLFWPLIVTNSLETRTLPVGLTILNQSYAGQYRPMVLAGAVLSSLPILIVYIIFQRRIIQGVMLTGMGGR